MNKILLMDGNSLTYRAFFGSSRDVWTFVKNKDGIAVNAVITFNYMIHKAIRQYNPSHIFIAFDAGKKTFRHLKLDTYKGGRKSTPEDLIVQFPIIKTMLDKMGIKHFETTGIEADDIIGTLATRFAKDNNVLVMSSDKDLYQLVQPGVDVIVPQNGAKENKLITIDNFFDTVGYKPTQVIDMKGLTGDSSDNLPGVAGIGDVGAAKLLARYETLEDVYENIDDHTIRQKKCLLDSKKMAFLCKELATLKLDVEVPFTINQMKVENKVTPELLEFFEKYNLHSLIRRFSPKAKKEEKNTDTQINFDKFLL